MGRLSLFSGRALRGPGGDSGDLGTQSLFATMPPSIGVAATDPIPTLCTQNLSWPAAVRATQARATSAYIQRADARWLGGPVKPGHDNFFGIHSLEPNPQMAG